VAKNEVIDALHVLFDFLAIKSKSNVVCKGYRNERIHILLENNYNLYSLAQVLYA
jgi:hypothetical protein